MAEICNNIISTSRLSTCCYLKRGSRYLMLHRVKKREDINKGKWLGVGGKFEPGEAPEDCLRREVFEETGFKLLSQVYRGTMTFIYADREPEYIFFYTSEDFKIQEPDVSRSAAGAPSSDTACGMFPPVEGSIHGTTGPESAQPDFPMHQTGGTAGPEAEFPLPCCNEGEFAWIEEDRIMGLELWEGDRYMLEYLLSDRERPFSLRLSYDSSDRLLEAWELSGEPVCLKARG